MDDSSIQNRIEQLVAEEQDLLAHGEAKARDARVVEDYLR